ncbi:hypothetical protein [Ferrovibrio sp.]|uniref:hypothetical protein n=1 Tax=Ferrovibrio sp. TaxID=1917215 RepID=UPI0026372A7B|nr:hypothetical protein [Ferrovibrio sp.]
MSDLGPLLPTPPVPPAGNSGTSAAPATATPASTTPTAAEGAAVQTAAAVIQPGSSAPAQAQPQTTQPQTTQPQTPQSQTPSPATVLQDAAAEISTSLRELARGGQVDATVIARDGNALLVRTAAGSTLSLPNLASVLQQANITVLNAALRLQLNPENPQQATLTAANGSALPVPLAVQVQPPTAAQLALAVAPPQPATTGAPVLPQPGQTLAATVQTPPAPAGAGASAAQSALPPGSQIQVVVQAAILPAATAPPPAASPSVATAPVTTPPVTTPPIAVPPTTAQPGGAMPGASLPAPAGAAAPLPAGGASPAPSVILASPAAAQQAAPLASGLSPAMVAQMTAQASAQPAIQPPMQTAAPPPVSQPVSQSVPPPLPAQTMPPLPPGAAPLLANAAVNPATLIGQTLTGVVTGQSNSGQVLVSTPQGLLALSLPQPLPPGTQLSLELAAITRPPTPAPTSLGPAPLASVLTRLQGEWPVLQQTLDAIRAADPALAQRLQAELLPQPNARLAATALQFMAAAAAGNAQAWLGSEAVRRLEQQGKRELLRRLDDDFRELGRLNQRGGDNDWQALVMPMLIGGKVEPVQIFMRRRRDQKQKQQQTRFIIDFNLESTGPIQFDGLVSVKQLDLILRSETEFGPAFRVDVMAIFEEALAVTGMSGSLRFHEREAPLAWPSPELETKGPSTELKA